jgi:hypothetical protein
MNKAIRVFQGVPRDSTLLDFLQAFEAVLFGYGHLHPLLQYRQQNKPWDLYEAAGRDRDQEHREETQRFLERQSLRRARGSERQTVRSTAAGVGEGDVDAQSNQSPSSSQSSN